MLSVPGYSEIQEVSRGKKFLVSRARRDGTGQAVILKSPATDFPSPREISSLHREFDLLRALALPCTPRALALETVRGRPMLVLEDDGGVPLRDFLRAGPLTTSAFLEIAIPLAAAVEQVHKARVIHKDLNPSNILLARDGRAVKVLDFGIATRAANEPQRLSRPHLLEGTIAYMSPEQTGRMNRDIDYRSDLYSLGVTLYEALTGRLPFDADDPLAVLHAHIAQEPVPPAERDRRVPRPVSDLVLKLMAKAPEDRYQSAGGLLADLTRCAEDLRASGGVSPFPLGQRDVPTRFTIPQRLYGREAEIGTLRRAFSRACQGATELVLVGGYSGIGKTSLIQELHKELPRSRGNIASGKFDQLGRDIPYNALRQAMGGLVRQLLTESDEQVREWGRRVREALGANAQVVVEVIPDLERIIGEQPPVPPLDAAETQNRFNRVFERFVGLFARPEHPLVLFLDDLQWADAGSLSLIPALLTGETCRGLLILGAYRDNEVTAAHPLRSMLGDLASHGVATETITLPPLSHEPLRRFVADSMRAAETRAKPVADLVLEKTAGNPFFVTQFLQALHQDGLLVFDEESGEWTSDLEGIRRANITDNVADLMTRKIQRLGPEARAALRLAACVGNRFDLATLATISERSRGELAAHLAEAAEQGLVFADGAEEPDGAGSGGDDGPVAAYRFLHDRVQQAAYDQIAVEDRPAVHLGIGRLLVAGGASEDDDSFFEAVNHLNLGARRITDETERLRLAEWNLKAGRRARASGAYRNAGAYFAAGADLLPDTAWETRHALTFDLNLERYETEYLQGRFDEAEAGYQAMLRRCDSPLERAEITVRRIARFETMAQYLEATRAGLEALRPLGIDIPDDPAQHSARFQEERRRIFALQGDRPLDSLVDLPPLEDATVRQAIRLLMAIWAPAYISGQAWLRRLAAAAIVRLSMEHGNCEESAFGYLHHGITIGYDLDEYARAHQFGLLAIALNERLADPRLHAAIHHRFAALLNLWTQPFPSCIEHAREAVRAGVESGQLQVAAYAMFQQTWYAMLLDRDLDEFEQHCLPTIEALVRLKSPAFLAAQRLIAQWGRALRGRTSAPHRLSDAEFDEEAFAATFAQAGIFKGLLATLRLELQNTFGMTEEARRHAREEEANAEIFASSIWPALFTFHHALALCAAFPESPGPERDAEAATLERLIGRLGRWAENAPENFGVMHRLACAEEARVLGRTGQAIESYEHAIALAERQRSPRHRALAAECYGRFWVGRGQPRIGLVFLAEARTGYAEWGATAKVAWLDERYRDLFARPAPVAGAGTGILGTTTTTSGLLDAAALSRAAQTISREIELDRLLERLLRVVLESAGADRGSIFLERDGALELCVQGTAEQIQVQTESGAPLDAAATVGVVQLVRRTGESVVLDDATADERFRDDPYVLRERPRSVLVTPLQNQGKLVGVVYLENRLASAAFRPDRVQMTQILSAQAAIAVENARLFHEVSRLRDRLQEENVYLQTEIRKSHGFSDIVGETPALRQVLAQIEQVAPARTTVLIQGETGTGKELVARAIHRLSPRAERPLIAVNCGAISPGLVESELFGHEKGAFTGALSRKLGRFELADGGTIFLDEIGDLPHDLQTKLLRVLQEGEFERVGGTRPIKVDVRVIAATHRDLEAAVEQGKFRQDLFYRLHVFPVRLPPLRERRADIPLLVRHFVLAFGTRLGRRVARVPAPIMSTLTAYDWPGNVRELANVVERSILVSQGDTLVLGDWFAPSMTSARPAEPIPPDSERDRILRALEKTGWRVSGPRGAAIVLGVKPTTLEARMKRMGISRPR